MPESNGAVSFWIGTVVVSLVGTFLLCGFGGIIFGPSNPPLVEKLLFQPAFYWGHLSLSADARSFPASDYWLHIRSKSSWRWAWSKPGFARYRQATIEWRAYSYRPNRNSEGKAEIDLTTWQIRHQGVTLPLDEDHLSRLAGIDITTAEARNELSAFLDYLKQAGAGTLRRAGHHGYEARHGALRIRMFNSVYGFPPFPFLVAFAFCLGLTLVWAKCPGPWREKRCH